MGENDLISRAALEKALNDLMIRRGVKSWRDTEFDASDFEDLIDEAPAVDAEPVRHGQWGFLGMDMMAGSRAFYFGTCSECRERINFEAAHKNYCPNCGAKMDGENECSDG